MSRLFCVFCLVFSLMLILSEVASARSISLASFPVPEEQAVVYDENANGVPDTFGDTWVFDSDHNNSPDLIIRFRQSPALTAFVYDDLNANNRVDYLIGDTDIQVLEPYWRLQIVARDGKWILPNNLPDWNL